MKNVSSKMPFLVAPWKIGFLVALLLIVVGAGAGSYLIKIYNVELPWMEDSAKPWQIDSYQFFREMYPLVASVIILSLISYFMISAAVRRYKSYLDSGQDYRAMVALAKSIDDLTNPAQISKLAAYPELQSVLRNYGDSIREISQELERKEQEFDPEGIEKHIESLFRGQKPKGDDIADVKWEKIFVKVGDYFEANRQEIEELRERSNTARKKLSEVVLSLGKLLETIATANEGLFGIAEGVKELRAIASGSGTARAQPPAGAPDPGEGGTNVIIEEMINTLNKLEDGGRVLSEFSTENNGLALNMALKAAKGAVEEHDLAQFAEKVRATAERFNRLSGTVSSIAEGLLGNCYQLAEKMGSGGAAAPAAGGRTAGEIAADIEARTARFEQSFSRVQAEMNEVHTKLQDCISALTETAVQVAQKEQSLDEGESPPSDEPAFVNFGGYSGDEENDGSDMVIQHGSMWDASFGPDAQPGEEAGAEGEQIGSSEMLDEIDVTMGEESVRDQTETVHDAEPLVDIPDDVYEQPSALGDDAAVREYTIEVDEPQQPSEHGAAEGNEEASGDQPEVGWEALQQVGEASESAPGSAGEAVDQAPEQPQAAQETVDLSPEAAAAQMQPPVDENQPAADIPPADEDRETTNEPGAEWVKVDIGGDAEESAAQGGVAGAEEDDEPVYDLFELGAVEYVEETKP